MRFKNYSYVMAESQYFCIKIREQIFFWYKNAQHYIKNKLTYILAYEKGLTELLPFRHQFSSVQLGKNLSFLFSLTDVFLAHAFLSRDSPLSNLETYLATERNGILVFLAIVFPFVVPLLNRTWTLASLELERTIFWVKIAKIKILFSQKYNRYLRYKLKQTRTK